MSPTEIPAVGTEAVATPVASVVPVTVARVEPLCVTVNVTVSPATTGMLADVSVSVAVSVVSVFPVIGGLFETLLSAVSAWFTVCETAVEVLVAKLVSPT